MFKKIALAAAAAAVVASAMPAAAGSPAIGAPTAVQDPFVGKGVQQMSSNRTALIIGGLFAVITIAAASSSD